jgi:hypothetical protein
LHGAAVGIGDCPRGPRAEGDQPCRLGSDDWQKHGPTAVEAAMIFTLSALLCCGCAECL